MLLIELKIPAGIVVRDIFYHLTQQFTIVRQQALLHIIAENVTEDTTEILMTRITEE